MPAVNRERICSFLLTRGRASAAGGPAAGGAASDGPGRAGRLAGGLRTCRPLSFFAFPAMTYLDGCGGRAGLPESQYTERPGRVAAPGMAAGAACSVRV